MRRSLPLALLSASILVVVPSQAEPPTDDFIDRRVGESPSCSHYLDKLSPKGELAWQALKTETERLGRMPSLAEYADLIISSEGPFTKDDRLAFFACFGAIQRPKIEKEDLHKLLHAQRASMESFRVRYTTEYRVYTNTDDPPKMPMRLECDFALDGEKVFFEKSVFHDDVLEDIRTESYDGEILQTLLEHPGSTPYGTIMMFDGRYRFFKEGNPILCAGLLDGSLDSEREVSSLGSDFAMDANLRFIYETPVTIRDIECLAVGSMTDVFYCSPEHMYALVERTTGYARFDKASGGYVRKTSSAVRTNSGFVRASDQVWLPAKSKYVLTREGQIVNEYVTTVSRYQLNDDLPEGLFSEIIPDGATVTDGLLGVVYVLGQSTEED